MSSFVFHLLNQKVCELWHDKVLYWTVHGETNKNLKTPCWNWNHAPAKYITQANLLSHFWYQNMLVVADEFPNSQAVNISLSLTLALSLTHTHTHTHTLKHTHALSFVTFQKGNYSASNLDSKYCTFTEFHQDEKLPCIMNSKYHCHVNVIWTLEDRICKSKWEMNGWKCHSEYYTDTFSRTSVVPVFSPHT